MGMLVRESSASRQQGLFLSVDLDGKKQNLDPMWKTLMRHVDLEELRRFLITCTWDALNTNVNRTKVWLRKTEMFESRISPGATEKLLDSEKSGANVIAWSNDMEGHAKKCVERYCELSHQKTFSNCVRSPHNVLTTFSSKKKNWIRWENFQKYDLKSS